jgi:hypothetical protein|tara:strand:+ start:741 stop:1007 length:267 start_codon:yes stop_codon:yes gene_type:complete
VQKQEAAAAFGRFLLVSEELLLNCGALVVTVTECALIIDVSTMLALVVVITPLKLLAFKTVGPTQFVLLEFILVSLLSVMPVKGALLM